MEKRGAPSEQKAQAVRAVLPGQSEGQSGEEVLSLVVRLATERILPEALEHEHAEALGRGRYEARGEKSGYRNGDENGTLQTGAGVLHVKVPQIRGLAGPYRSQLWRNVGNTSDVLTKVMVEMYVGGTSQRDIEYGLEQAVGQCVVSKSTAREMAEQFLSLAEKGQDPVLLLEAHYMLGETLYFLGELVPARAHLGQEVVISTSQKHHHVHDPVVGYLFDAALDLWSLGYPDQALKKSHKALTLAREMSHPFSLALALHFAAILHLFRREMQAVQERAEELITLSTEQGFSFRGAVRTIYRGWVLSEHGQGGEGIAEMHRGLAAMWATGAGIGLSGWLALLAAAYARVGRIEEGLTLLDNARALIDKTGERWNEVGLYVLKGWLTLRSQPSPKQVSDKSKPSQRSKHKTQNAKVTDPRPLIPDPQGEAEACFLKAIDIARQQSAKSWELRAVMSLARLWQQQDKQNEAHQMLSEVYGWFTEGFDTKDLQEAKTLLDELRR